MHAMQNETVQIREPSVGGQMSHCLTFSTFTGPPTYHVVRLQNTPKEFTRIVGATNIKRELLGAVREVSQKLVIQPKSQNVT